MWLDILGSNLSTCIVYTWTNLYGMVHISIRSGDMTTTCLVESTNYVRLCCLYIYVVEQHRCSSDCFFFHFVAHAGVSHQTWRLAQLLGKYSMCIVLGPFQKGIKAKRKSATNPPQWIHIPLRFLLWFVFFLYCCFFVAAFMLSAEAQRLIPRTHGEGKEPWPTICLDNLSMLIR